MQRRRACVDHTNGCVRCLVSCLFRCNALRRHVPSMVVAQLCFAAAYRGAPVVSLFDAVQVLDLLHLALLVLHVLDIACGVAAAGGLGVFWHWQPPFTTAAQACFNRLDTAIILTATVGTIATRAVSGLRLGALPQWAWVGSDPAQDIDLSRLFLLLPLLRSLTLLDGATSVVFKFVTVLSRHWTIFGGTGVVLYCYVVLLCLLFSGHVDSASVLNFDTFAKSLQVRGGDSM